MNHSRVAPVFIRDKLKVVRLSLFGSGSVFDNHAHNRRVQKKYLEQQESTADVPSDKRCIFLLVTFS